LCETISGKSEHARGDGDPYIKTADFISENGLTMLNLMTTLAELKKLGWLIVDGPRMGPDGLNPRWFQPSEDFFLATEAAFGGPDPWTDAKQLAGGGGGEAGRAITRRRIARAAARLERSSNKRGAIRA
jgi:hypothetical protein